MPGWYQAPNGPPGQLRYWDGAAWGPVAPPVAPAAQTYHPPPGLGGYLVALILPIVGFIWAVVLFVRGQVGDGVGMIFISIVGSWIGYLLLAA